MGPRDQAKRLLVNYFEVIAKKAGMPWQSDYTVEIEDAVDAIVEASANEAEERIREILKDTAVRSGY